VGSLLFEQAKSLEGKSQEGKSQQERLLFDERLLATQHLLCHTTPAVQRLLFSACYSMSGC
jgi:hypothetical protein